MGKKVITELTDEIKVACTLPAFDFFVIDVPQSLSFLFTAASKQR